MRPAFVVFTVVVNALLGTAQAVPPFLVLSKARSGTTWLLECVPSCLCVLRVDDDPTARLGS